MARTKKLDRRYLDHLAGVLRPIVEREFGGNATAFAKHVGVSQPQVAQLLRADSGGGVGIVVLMALRRYLGMSIDDMLGLPPLPARAPVPVDAIQKAVEVEVAKRSPSAGDLEAIRELLREFRDEQAAAPPRAKKRRS